MWYQSRPVPSCGRRSKSILRSVLVSTLSRWWAARPMSIRKMIDESKGGVRYVDVHVGGSESIITGLLPEGILEPVEPLMLLPEVKDTKQWWGGHIWVGQCQEICLLIARPPIRKSLVQPANGETGRGSVLRRFARRKMAKQNRLSRSAHAGLRRVDLVLYQGG